MKKAAINATNGDVDEADRLIDSLLQQSHGDYAGAIAILAQTAASGSNTRT
jgi:hypothetical protein